MKVVKAYKYKLKTNLRVENKLNQISGSCRFVYNLFLNQRVQEYKTDYVNVNYYDQAIQLPLLKEEYPWLKEAPSQVLQQKLKDLDQAYKNFFRRVTSGGVPGFAKFKKKGVHDSFRYPQGVKVEGSRIFLPKVGWVFFRKSRDIEGKIKNVTVSRSASGWYVSIQTEKDVPDTVHPSNTTVGVDVGVKIFAALSDGTIYEPVNSLKKLEKKLSKAQRDLSRKKKGSNNRKKQIQKVALLHEKVANARMDYLHNKSTEISKNHAVVVLEDLKVSNMSRSAKGTIDNPGKNVKAKAGLNKSILDQGWGMFRNMLEYKLKYSGGSLILVNPKYTSQTCSNCGHVSKDNRKSQSNFQCTVCGYEHNADVNAAKNIMAVGLTVSACGAATLVAQ
jgi:putative transposase